MADSDGAGSKGLRRSAHVIPDSQPEMVAEVVRAVLATLSGDLSAQETSLLAEVEALGHTIARAKAEIAALRVDDITDNHIPFATDELDAIVEHTATATNAILTSCETLDEVAGEPGRRSRRPGSRMPPRASMRRAASRTSPASASTRSSGR